MTPLHLCDRRSVGEQWQAICNSCRYIQIYAFTSTTPLTCFPHSTTANLHPLSARQTLLFVLLTLAGAAAMTSIFQKLTRPFTSSTLRFAPEQTARMDVPEGAQKCTVAAGCFWGVEHMYRKDFGNKGLLDARVGYIGGDTKSPSYRSVCSGTTGRK